MDGGDNMKRKFYIVFAFAAIILIMFELVHISEYKKSSLDKKVLAKSYENRFTEKGNYLNTNSLKIKSIKIISHRGQGFGGQENSIEAIANSIKAKVDYAEIDVQETRDGVVVLMHDKNLKRLTGLDKEVSQLTFKEVEGLSIAPPSRRNTIERIPTLDEVVKRCKGKLHLIIEIKPYWNTEDLTDKVIGIIDKYDYYNQCKIHSISYKALLQVKRLNPKIQTGYIVGSRNVNNLCLLKVNFYSIRENILNKRLVDYIHVGNKEVYAWTVDGKTDMNNMLKLKVDGIISDKPQILLGTRKKSMVHKI